MLVPPSALTEWITLAAALREHGPAPCEGGVLAADAWYSTAVEDRELARLACRVCPVQIECGAYAAAAHEREGMWAGMTPEERADGRV